MVVFQISVHFFFILYKNLFFYAILEIRDECNTVQTRSNKYLTRALMVLQFQSVTYFRFNSVTKNIKKIGGTWDEEPSSMNI